jgi:Family of unknown function (DUF6101)
MEAGGIPPAGSARALRLDPFALPVRYPAKDSGADGQVRQVELHRERVVLRRAVRGMRMSVGVPVSAFRGVALRLVPADGVEPAVVTVMLDHNDHALSVPLYVASDSDDVAAIWKAWGRVFGLPLLVAENDGALREPFVRLGGLAIDDPQPRRRRRSVLKRRRPSIFLRRKPGRRIDGARVHRGEHEIIARN